MDDINLLLTILSALLSLFVLIFVLVKLHKIEQNTRKTQHFFNTELLYQHLLRGDQECINKFMEEETARLLAQEYCKDQGSGYTSNTDYACIHIKNICDEYNLELPEVLVKFDTKEKIKELLK